LKMQRPDMPPLRSSDARTLIRPGQAILEYLVEDNESYLFFITASDVSVSRIRVSRKEIIDLTEKFRSQLGSRDPNFRPSARALYDLLIAPAYTRIVDVKELIIVPDAELWNLPFQALMNNKNQYLLDEFPVSYLPSVTSLLQMRQARGQQKRVADGHVLLAYGNPLLSAEMVARAKFAY